MKTLEFQAKGEEYGYLVYLPNNYDENKVYPLIVSLHGAGERGNGSSELHVLEKIGYSRYFKEGLLEVDAIVVTPQCPQGTVWNQHVFKVKAFIDKIISEYNVDENRVSLTGMSMGGFGTWEMAMTFPEMFSAIAPVCGGGMAWRAPVLKGMPVWAVHGDADGTVNISNSVEMVNAARCYSSNVKFTVFNGVGHNSWDGAYLDTTVSEWLISHDRRVRFEK